MEAMQNLSHFSFVFRAMVMRFLAIPIAFCPLQAQAGVLTIDDVLTMVSIDKVAPSPDGRDLAIVVQRPVGEGEIAGRTSYEIDPSRTDIWLMRRDGSEKRNLTQGRDSAAGYWCAQWSPDGERIAMLSTQPEANEPRGGDAVRLYVWAREQDKLVRLSERPMMTMTRYGSPLNALDLRGGAGSDRKPHECRRYDENAPFLWLDNRRLLVVQMPEGQDSALFTQHGRPFEHAAIMERRLRGGRENTVDVSDTERDRLADAVATYHAEIALIDAVTGEQRLLARVPAFPFRGMLSLVVSPDRKTLAILAPSAAIPPHRIGRKPFNNDETQSEKRLALLHIGDGSPVHWITMPGEAEYPLDLLDWSSDGRTALFRARRTADERNARFFALDAASGAVTSVAPDIVNSPDDAGTFPHDASAQWLHDGGLLVRGRPVSNELASETWWRAVPGRTSVAAADPKTPPTPALPDGAELLARDAHGLIWQQPTDKGLVVRASVTSDDPGRDLLVLDRHLATVDWGELRTITYTGATGRPLKALVILPPGHRPGQLHPTLVWVYPGTMIRGADDYWDDRRLPGIYNLQLYAAKGYAVLVPSMPLPAWDGGLEGPYAHLTQGVLPAIDRIVELGLADPKRMGVFGQSFGGYATYALVTQTDRFAAAAAIAGASNLISDFGAFDRGASGWPGIAQDKSINPTIHQSAMRMGKPPYLNPEGYAVNSPVNHAAKIRTPLLMAHGSLDIRAGIDQAETVFTLLDQQGKPARLLRYEGEGHAIAQSPANVRHLFDELIAWFDSHLKDTQPVRK